MKTWFLLVLLAYNKAPTQTPLVVDPPMDYKACVFWMKRMGHTDKDARCVDTHIPIAPTK